MVVPGERVGYVAVQYCARRKSEKEDVGLNPELLEDAVGLCRQWWDSSLAKAAQNDRV